MSARHKRILKEVGLGVVAAVEFALVVFVLGWKVGFSPVLSGSMGSSLPTGSIAVTAQKLTEEVRVGDIVRLPFPGGASGQYVHRIVDLTATPEGYHIRTKGDANPTVDAWQVVIVSTYTPHVIGYIPLVGYLHQWTNHVWAKTSLLVSIVGFLALAGYRLVARAVTPESNTLSR